ncbi:MAG: urease accessory protein UreF, partial [Candidatus Ornithomonoglobus sp.]
GFTLSNGMETYVSKGIVHDEKTLLCHLTSYLYILRFNDLAFASMARRGEDIEELDMLCSAYRAPYELRDGSRRQCMRFLKLHTELDDYMSLKKYLSLIKEKKCDGHYCIAMGLFIKEIGTDIETALELYCYSIISAMTNHAVKLVPLRQLDGQRALFEASEKIPETVRGALRTDKSELGAGGCGFDIRSMQHEGLYSRLYMS